jgi:hypothetical protein
MPVVVSGDTNAATTMVGENAAAWSAPVQPRGRCR